jgi:hypothetical protein
VRDAQACLDHGVFVGVTGGNRVGMTPDTMPGHCTLLSIYRQDTTFLACCASLLQVYRCSSLPFLLMMLPGRRLSHTLAASHTRNASQPSPTSPITRASTNATHCSAVPRAIIGPGGWPTSTCTAAGPLLPAGYIPREGIGWPLDLDRAEGQASPPAEGHRGDEVKRAGPGRVGKELDLRPGARQDEPVRRKRIISPGVRTAMSDTNIPLGLVITPDGWLAGSLREYRLLDGHVPPRPVGYVPYLWEDLKDHPFQGGKDSL